MTVMLLFSSMQDDGTEEVVVCSWDGHTYFINLNRDAVRFHCEETVVAFCAGTKYSRKLCGDGTI